MAKQEQILIIDPLHELKFQGPFTTPVTSYMKLTNPSNHKVCFKIKTTAPKKYCVRPNSGVLDSKDVANIAVSLQPFEFDPTEKNKHKFMVQTMVAPDGEFNFDSLWKDVTPDNLMDSKLKCVFEMPVEDNNTGPVIQELSTAVEDKSKRVGDSPSVTHDGELVKAAKEVKHLREEESSLRQENLQLKEELMRLRSASAHNVSSHTSHPTPPSMSPVQATSPLMIIIAVGMAIIGLILGKYIL